VSKKSSGELYCYRYYDYSSSEEEEEEGCDESDVRIGPAEEYFEEDSLDEMENKFLTPGLTYLLDCFHSFGCSDNTVFLELCKSIQSVSVPAGEFVFKVGDADEFMYVVESGSVDVHIVDEDDKRFTIKVAGPGETVSSHLSLIDYLTSSSNAYTTVCGRALVDSVMIKVPSEAFKEVFDDNPDMMIRVVQLTMARLQRVVFVGLHRYLGLTSELIGEWDGGNQMDEDSIDSSLECLGEGSEHSFPTSSHANRDILIAVAVNGFQKELGIKGRDSPIFLQFFYLFSIFFLSFF
jgi:hypothetical protein